MGGVEWWSFFREAVTSAVGMGIMSPVIGWALTTVISGLAPLEYRECSEEW